MPVNPGGKGGLRMIPTTKPHHDKGCSGGSAARDDHFHGKKRGDGMKQTFSLLLALMLTASLAACGPARPTSLSHSGPAASPIPALSPAPTKTPSVGSASAQEGKVLVAYFSATGATARVAAEIAAYLNADLFEITPETPYTEADLDYNGDCRANDEQQNDLVRPALAAGCTVEDWDSYEVVFLGHPIWWGIPPKIMRTFAEQYDWSGKTIVPFCTSGGSEYSAEGLPELTRGAHWVEGSRFHGEEPAADLAAWVDGLALGLSADPRDTDPQNTDLQSAGSLTVRCGDLAVVYELNDSAAARALLAQLPLSLQVEPFGSNEQTFYPPKALEVGDTPAITSAEAGILAYYAPWGDVVMFYGDFSGGGDGLYELGKAVDGVDALQNFSGGIIVSTE